MNITQPDYYREFSCIAGDCPDSCCIGWQVVPDAEHLAFYKTLEGELGDSIRAGIIDIDGEPSFSLCNGRCCMLRDDGLCKIQYALGEDALSTVCGFYPRFVTELGLIREEGLSISCPEVARIILTRKDPITFRTHRTEEPLRYFHDIDPERILAVRQGRDKAISVLQDRNLSLASRMEKLLSIGIQVDEVDLSEIDGSMTDDAYSAFRTKLYDLFLSLERLRPDWTVFLEQGKVGTPLKSLDEDPCWEHLLVYFLYKYALRSAMDDNFMESILLSILSVILLQDLHRQKAGDLIHMIQLYAKETEHNEDNLSILMNAPWEDETFSPEAILSLLQRFL